MATDFEMNVAFVRRNWPEAIKEDASGFYWQNLDGDRFYFPTWEDAANDLAIDTGVTDAERLTGVEGVPPSAKLLLIDGGTRYAIQEN